MKARIVSQQLGLLHSISMLLLLVVIMPNVGQAQFNYETNNGTITITGYTGPGGDVTIPEIVNGMAVTSVGDWVFQDCTNLTSVTMGNGVTSIGVWAFGNCTSLTSVSIGNSVTSIGESTFKGCTNLATVKIGRSVAAIGLQSFECCTALTTIAVDPLNPFYSSVDGVLFNKSQTVLIQYPGGKAGDYALPSGVTSILTKWIGTGNGRFHGGFDQTPSVIRVTLPNSMTNIGAGVFARCTGLPRITIPESVTSIGERAFQDCTGLTNVSLGNSVTSIGWAAFRNCTGLTSITIPNGVTSIGESAFEGCSGLTSVTIGNSVTSIEGFAFLGCTGLTSITIPGSVTSIGNGAFNWCISLRAAYFEGQPPSLEAGGVFDPQFLPTIYYLPGTAGWDTTFGGCATALWLPQFRTGDSTFGVQSNRFGFTVSWASDRALVVEASTSLTNPTWSPVSTNTLAGGTSYFSDAEWSKYPSRFYRIRSP